MIIVSGRIRVAPTDRQEFVEASLPAVIAARKADGCLDFIVAADPLEGDRVNVYEEWETEDALQRFRGDGPSEEIAARILAASVRRHHVSDSGPA